MDNGSIIRATAGEYHALVKQGRGLVVFGNQILATADGFEEPISFARGLSDEEIWEFFWELWKERTDE